MTGSGDPGATVTLPPRLREGGAPEVVRLQIVFSPEPERVHALRVIGPEPLVVGRSAPGLALPDPRASRAHAAFEVRDGRAHVRDLGSHNGTFVEGAAVAEAPLDDGTVVRIGDHLLVVQELRSSDLSRAIEAPPRIDTMVGDGRAMRELRADVSRAAPGDVPVLILGETGSGKELVASEIHRGSGRRGRFVPVNCAAIPNDLAEAELFGYVRGAFTGAVEDALGLFGAAEGGTIFLDEIGDMPLALQAKLLRAVATREVRRVGETGVRHVDVRIVAATHRDLAQAVDEKTFRGDLLSRLAGHVVRVPPLSRRRDDVLDLAAHFLTVARGDRRDGHVGDRVARSFTADAAETLLLAPWRFNVRELEQTVRAAAARVEHGAVDTACLAPILRGGLQRHSTPTAIPSFPLARVLEVRPDVPPTADELRAVIEHFGGRVSRVAAFFGKERRQIYRWAERHGLDLGASAND